MLKLDEFQVPGCVLQSEMHRVRQHHEVLEGQHAVDKELQTAHLFSSAKDVSLHKFKFVEGIDHLVLCVTFALTDLHLEVDETLRSLLSIVVD